MTVDPRRALPLATVASGATDLSAALRTRTARGALSVCGPGDALTCSACAHRCVFPRGSGRAGACGVRFEHEGELRVPFGYVARMYTRPVETNTIYHVLPGSLALTFGMYGCDLRCPYCQNARISQALREPVVGEAPIDVSPDDVIGLAVNSGCRVVCAAYNEPAIAAEWVHAIFARAKARGLVTAMITDGHATREVLAFLRPVTDVYRVDLKGADQATYRTLGGRLDPVLDAIRHAKELGFWVEVVTLLVPGLNDDLGGVRALATTLAGIDPSIPWHLNAFQPRYRMKDRPRMDAGMLVSAAGIAYARGVQFVYVGNIDDTTTELASTRCPSCHEVVVARRDYSPSFVAADPSVCRRCAAAIPGLWSAPAERHEPGVMHNAPPARALLGGPSCPMVHTRRRPPSDDEGHGAC